MRIVESTLSEPDWDHLVSVHGGSIHQTVAYGRASGCLIRRYEIQDKNDRVGVFQVLIRRLFGPLKIGLLSRGPVWFDPIDPPPIKFPKSIAPFVLHTADVGAKGGGIPLVSEGSYGVLDISQSLDLVRGNLHQKWRNRLRFARQNEVSVNVSDDVGWIFDREVENRGRHKYKGLPIPFLRRICLNDKSYLFIQARKRHVPVAGALFLIHGQSATYQIGWSGHSGRRLNTQNLVLWDAIGRLKAKGIKSIDLGLIDTENNPGLARFKLGTGADLRTFGPTRLQFGFMNARFFSASDELAPSRIQPSVK